MASSMRRYYCKLCGAAFATNRTDRHFCSSDHQKEWNNIRIKGGLRLYDFAMASRVDRSAANQENVNQARRDLYVEIDRLAEEERIRRAHRSEKIAEIRAGGLLPQPVEPIDDNDEAATDFAA